MTDKEGLMYETTHALPETDQPATVKLSESDIRRILTTVHRVNPGSRIVRFDPLHKAIRGAEGYTVISFERTAGMAQRGNEWFIDTDFRQTYGVAV
jgi:hypothetical protein